MRNINVYLLSFMEREGVPSLNAIRRELPDLQQRD